MKNIHLNTIVLMKIQMSLSVVFICIFALSMYPHSLRAAEIQSCTIDSFATNKTILNPYEAATLSWTTTGCTGVLLGTDTTVLPADGSKDTEFLLTTGRYTITGIALDGSLSALSNTGTVTPITVRVRPISRTCKITSFTAIPDLIDMGEMSTLSWTTDECLSVVVSNIPDQETVRPANGSASTGRLNITSRFNLVAQGENNTVAILSNTGPVYPVTVHVRPRQSTPVIVSAQVPETPFLSRAFGVSGAIATVPTSAPSVVTATPVVFTRTLKIRATGDDVKALQALLGVSQTGFYGVQTVQKVKEWQRTHNLTPDGVFGVRSRAFFTK
jgi:peptidoglycan hydrolase-like protein with peptidoglycan-binding domain